MTVKLRAVSGINNLQETLDFKCPANHYVAGIKNQFDVRKEDRV